MSQAISPEPKGALGTFARHEIIPNFLDFYGALAPLVDDAEAFHMTESRLSTNVLWCTFGVVIPSGQIRYG